MQAAEVTFGLNSGEEMDKVQIGEAQRSQMSSGGK